MVYLPLLASHIVLAIVALPLVLVTFFFSLTGRIRQHRKVPAGLSALALCIGHRCDYLRDAAPGARVRPCQRHPRRRNRQLLRWGGTMLGAGCWPGAA